MILSDMILNSDMHLCDTELGALRLCTHLPGKCTQVVHDDANASCLLTSRYPYHNNK